MEVALFTFATVVFTIAGIFQILRMKKTGSARDVSVWFLICMALGVYATTALVYIKDSHWLVLSERIIASVTASSVYIVAVFYKIKDYNAKKEVI